MSLGITHNLKSPYADERQRGFRWLRFAEFVEEEFRQAHIEANAGRARLVIGGAIATILVMIGIAITNPSASYFMLAFEAFVMLPVMGATLYASAMPDRQRLYQVLLAASALLIGLVINSVVTRATLAGMPYYFAATISWVFVVWLILGLPFRYAAATSLTISVTYGWGVVQWNLPIAEAYFEILMLGVVNLIGAICCYQLEHALRRSFLESKVLSQLAEQDGLTGLYNRRSFDQQLERLWRQSRREHTPLTLLLIDIDHFKAYNDMYGHQAGDDALKQVADVIGFGAQRPLDMAARYGGEEFALLLYGPASEYGRELPDQIREDVLALKIQHKDSDTGPYLTVSVGVAQVLPGAERSMAGAFQMADEALYEAKEAGRNRVVVKESNATLQTGRFRVDRSKVVSA
ncbi:MAG: GGDEF domain-containing protein [Gammaproteobacteria bacterium]|nr:GGDEF domain-containing protein [Gammaproteobacteria bacterium]